MQWKWCVVTSKSGSEEGWQLLPGSLVILTLKTLPCVMCEAPSHVFPSWNPGFSLGKAQITWRGHILVLQLTVPAEPNLKLSQTSTRHVSEETFRWLQPPASVIQVFLEEASDVVKHYPDWISDWQNPWAEYHFASRHYVLGWFVVAIDYLYMHELHQQVTKDSVRKNVSSSINIQTPTALQMQMQKKKMGFD